MGEGENHGIRLWQRCRVATNTSTHSFIRSSIQRARAKRLSTFRLARSSRMQGAAMGHLACCGVAAAVPSSTTVCERPCLDGRGIPSHPPHT